MEELRPRDAQMSPHGPSGMLGCLMLGLVGLMALAGMVALTLLSSGLFTPALLAGAAFFAYGLFHYVVWGWWLGGVIRREAESQETGREGGEASPASGRPPVVERAEPARRS